MAYILLIVTAALTTVQHGLTKQYSINARIHNVYMYTAATSVAAMLFFVVVACFKFNFKPELISYSLAFAIAFMAALVGSTYAIRTGSLALTSLIISYSLTIPMLHGLVFLHEEATVFTYTGIALLLISLYFVSGKSSKTKISFVWVIWIVIAFIGNGMCSVVQKMQQSAFGGEFKSEFMILALFIVTVVSFIIGLITAKGDRKVIIIDAAKYAPLKGIANGAVNFFVMVLTGALPSAILFPSISAGGIIFAYILSRFAYKEEYSTMQKIGFVLGVISAILLNI